VSAAGCATTGAKAKRPALYDTKADGEKQIAEALARAQRDNKRVLLQFGGNWCSWCHKMHELLSTHKEISKVVLYEYDLVLIDVTPVSGVPNNEAIVERYGQPTKHGLPVWVILDADGKQLTTVDTATLEIGEGYDNAKVLATLNKWKAPPRSANATLSTALARAAAQSKNVFIQFSAPWCVWCKRMDQYLLREDIASVFNLAYVPVKIDVERMTDGRDVQEKYGGTEETGLPFFAIVSPKGVKLADSVGPQGNCGFPVEPFEIEHYMNVVKATAGRLFPAQLAVLEHGLKKGLPGA
jgi:thiol:disulfide interchange protein